MRGAGDVGEPRWQEIRADLIARIRTGELPVGAPIPPLSELVARWGVSASTAQKAVRSLRDSGVLQGRPGVDVRVARVPAEDEPRLTTDQRLAELEGQLSSAQVRLAELEQDQGDTRQSVTELRQMVADLQALVLNQAAETGQPRPSVGGGTARRAPAAG